MQLKHLRHNEIDKTIWDERIAQSKLSQPYALSWYLDIVCPNWEALVSADYDYLMPLPIKYKCGIKYLVQPLWVQQLGVFSDKELTEDIINSFIRHIPYSIYAFNLNSINHTNKYCTRPSRINLTLTLNDSYAEIQSHYSSNTKRNIKKAQSHSLDIQELSVDSFISFWAEYAKQSSPNHLMLLNQITQAAQQRGNATIVAAIDGSNNVVAALFALNMPSTIVTLAPVSSPEGTQMSAMFLILDHLLRTNQSSNRLFDFEGSMIPGVARLYKGFGGVESYYYPISRLYPENLLKQLKRIL